MPLLKSREIAGGARRVPDLRVADLEERADLNEATRVDAGDEERLREIVARVLALLRAAQLSPHAERDDHVRARAERPADVERASVGDDRALLRAVLGDVSTSDRIEADERARRPPRAAVESRAELAA